MTINHDLTIPVPAQTQGARVEPPHQGKPVKRGTTVKNPRILFDAKSFERVNVIRDYIEREFGTKLSLSLIVRLALHNLTGNLADAVGTGDALGKRISAARDGR